MPQPKSHDEIARAILADLKEIEKVCKQLRVHRNPAVKDALNRIKQLAWTDQQEANRLFKKLPKIIGKAAPK